MAVPKIFIFVLVFCVFLIQCAVVDGKVRQHKITVFPKNVIPKTEGTPSLAPRVFGGTGARTGQFPYMVFVLYKTGRGFATCSASLIKPDVVLLAAHCLIGNPSPDPKNIIVVAGQAGLEKYIDSRYSIPWKNSVDEAAFNVQERRVIEAERHPQYNSESKENDVALLRLAQPFALNKNVQLIDIAPGKISSRTSCTILGWGLVEENERRYKLVYAENVIAKSLEEGCEGKSVGPFLCLEKSRSGICQGDSGSPLVCGGLVYGVASHLVAYEENPACGDDFEEYYADISSAIPFINDFLQIGGGEENVTPRESDKPGSSHINKSVLLFTSFLIFVVMLVR